MLSGMLPERLFAGLWRNAVWRALLIALAALSSGVWSRGSEASIVSIENHTCNGSLSLGSGTIVGPSRVLTSAHVVDESQAITVVAPDGVRVGTVVGFDAETDLALVEVDGAAWVDAQTVSARRVARGTTAQIASYRDGVPSVRTAVIRRAVELKVVDSAGTVTARRPGFELEGDVRPGDSGGALLVGGSLVGVVWARSTVADGRGYAIDVAAVPWTLAEKWATVSTVEKLYGHIDICT